jgi:hypothetical protein
MPDTGEFPMKNGGTKTRMEACRVGASNTNPALTTVLNETGTMAPITLSPPGDKPQFPILIQAPVFNPERREHHD